MYIKYLQTEEKWYPIKKAKNLQRKILSPKWVILQYVKLTDEYNKYIPYAILVDDNNYLEVISFINKQSKVLIISKNNLGIPLYKFCKKQKLNVRFMRY